MSGLIWSCPDCCGDLQDEGHNLYCPACDRTVTWFEFADMDPDDDRNDFYAEMTPDGL